MRRLLICSLYPPTTLIDIVREVRTNNGSTQVYLLHIARKADYNPPLQPLRMFHDAIVMDPLPSVNDGGREAVDAMRFLPNLARKMEKNPQLGPPYPTPWPLT